MEQPVSVGVRVPDTDHYYNVLERIYKALEKLLAWKLNGKKALSTKSKISRFACLSMHSARMFRSMKPRLKLIREAFLFPLGRVRPRTYFEVENSDLRS